MFVLVDCALPWAARALSGSCDVGSFVGRELNPETPGLADAHALVIRSTARISANILAAAPKLRVVSSATIGTDHMDGAAAVARGVTLTNAPGCNAPGVADWTVAAIVTDAARRGLPLAGRSAGVVGVGHTGSAVSARFAALGLDVVGNDPPRAAREPGYCSAPLTAALACDVVSLHVPLTDAEQSRWPTRGLIGEPELAALRPGTLLVNVARGGLIDEPALRAALGPPAGRGPAVALDTFDGEPTPALETLARAFRATPHIAGATAEGKWRAQTMAAEAAARALGGLPLTPVPAPAVTLSLDQRTPASPADPEGEAVAAVETVLRAALRLDDEDHTLRKDRQAGAPFDRQRDAHRRHELASLALAVSGRPSPRTLAALAAAGLRLAADGGRAHLRLTVE